MKNSPPAVAGGLFFCVPEWGVSRPLAASALFVSDGDNFAPAGASYFLSMSKESSQRTPLKERGISNFPLSLRILTP